MKKLLLLAVVLSALAACKTTEENYRAAYEKAVQGRDSAMAFEQTIYGRHRRNVGSRYLATPGGDTVEMRSQAINVTEGGGGIPQWLHAYSVAVGQFKQISNAKSMRERLADSGTAPRAFVVETAEPFYYIVFDSYGSSDAALAAIDSLAHHPLAVKTARPFILHDARKR